jgi:hypothetical protein
MLITIEHLMQDHEALQGHMQLLRKSADKWRELFNSMGSNNDLTHSQIIVEKRGSFIQAIGYLKDGLNSLHSQEEDVIQTIADPVSLRSIKSEHTRIMKKLEEIESLLIKLEPKVILTIGDSLIDIINDFCDLIMDHISIEDISLQLLNLSRARLLQPV